MPSGRNARRKPKHLEEKNRQLLPLLEKQAADVQKEMAASVMNRKKVRP
ncbi:MAG TPA: hypothetical protein VD996_16310 [Chitinophagaceae bacterium]|nr:hypothetical protein [Chitinophagaceae bacterium]